MKETDPYVEHFERFETQTKRPAWLFPLRKAGMARFAETGFPTVQDEDWRFTNVAPIAGLPFRPVFEASLDGLEPESVAGLTFGRIAAARLVFVDGHYAAALSSPGVGRPGVIIRSLAAALDDDSKALEKLVRWERQETGAFGALNLAFSTRRISQRASR